MTTNGTHPAALSRSSNGGASWQAVQLLYDQSGIAAYNNQVLALPDGSVADVFILAPWTGSSSNAIIRSFDHGATWSSPVLIPTLPLSGTTDPKMTGLSIRGGAPAVAADPTTGAIYLATEARFSGSTVDGISFTKSVDGGKYLDGAGAGQSGSADGGLFAGSRRGGGRNRRGRLLRLAERYPRPVGASGQLLVHPVA